MWSGNRDRLWIEFRKSESSQHEEKDQFHLSQPKVATDKRYPVDGSDMSSSESCS